MPSRRSFLVASVAAFIASCQSVWAQTPGVQIAELKDQLEKGLRARRPEEFAFIAHVLDMVDKKQLPVELVKSTFQWAREKAKYKRYPFPYFQYGLRTRAAKLGIRV